MKLIRFFRAAVAIRFSEEMVYKFNFFIRMFTLLTFDLVAPLITILIYVHSNGFVGWNFYEILLFQGIFMLVNSLDLMFFQRIDWSLSYDVRNGNFDRYLLYPINVLAYMSFMNFGFEHIADFTIGLGIIIYSLAKLSLHVSLQNILLFILFIGLAMLFMFTLAVLKYSIIIRTTKMGRLGEFFRTLKSYGQYPVDIYNAALSSVFRYLIPLAVIAYYPSKILLNSLSSNLFLAACVIIGIFLLAMIFWNRTLKHYTSAGG